MNMSTKNRQMTNTNGHPYPFKVTDSYFDGLTARIMKQIDNETAPVQIQTEEHSGQNTRTIGIQRKHRHFYIGAISIAASLVLVVTLALKLLPSVTTPQVEKPMAQAACDSRTEANYNDELISYAMADNMDVYYYLASEDFDQ